MLSDDLKIIKLIRNLLSVLIPILAMIWWWTTKQNHWLKDYMELSIVIVTSLITFCQFLIGRWSSSKTIEKNKFYNLSITQKNRDSLAQAKAAIGNGRPGEALKTLSDIKVETVTAAVSLLSGRWAKYKQDQRAGVLKDSNKSFQRISRDALSLISDLEAEMQTYGTVDEEIRNYLQKRYTNRLGQKLAKRQPINLRLLPTTEGTSEETAATFVTISAESVNTHITQIFQSAFGRLLITGKPGAGKTGVLLQLELALLESETDRLPVILNLATWKKDYITLEPWLKEILPAELGVSKKYAADILQQNRLILLLDGLDEVAEDDRTACLEAIGKYQAEPDSRYVITSRIGEYSAISKSAPVKLQIEVADLTPEQMEAELQQMGHEQPEAMPLLYAIRKHSTLRAAAQVPFYFNTLQLLFAGGKNLADIDLKGQTSEEIQAELIPQFVEYALTIPADKNYSSQEAYRWLSFLAHSMSERNMVVFELADLKYEWCPVRLSRWQLFVANFIEGLFAGLLGGLFGGLFIGLFAGLLGGLLYTLFFALPSSILYALSVGLNQSSYPNITTRDGVKWLWRLFLKVVRDKIFRLLFGGLFIGLFSALFVGVARAHFSAPFVGVTRALFAGIFLVPLYVFYVVLFKSLAYSSRTTLQLNRPYQRFKNSARMFHFSILQHWHLMYLLSRKGWLPWRIVPFLNDMVAQQLLECPDGATWRFRHRILQEHFAKKWETTARPVENVN